MKTATKRKKRPPGLDIDPALLETLVRALATVDASFTPVRDFDLSSSMQAAAYQSRTAYPSVGVAWFGGAGKAATDRKTHERAVAELRDLKMLESVKPSSRTTRVKLTDLGEAVARAAAGLPGLESGRLTVELVAELYEEKRPEVEGRRLRVSPMLEGFVPETALARVPWGEGNGRLFVIVEDMALPALIRGWLKWGCDSKKHVCYKVTAAGRKVLADGFPDLPGEDIVPFDDEIRTAYYDEFKSARARLESVQLDPPGEIGEIPLSNSCVGGLYKIFAEYSEATPEPTKAKRKAKLAEATE